MTGVHPLSERSVVRSNRLFIHDVSMPITKAIGLGISIIVLKILLPDVLSQIEETAIAFLKGAKISADVATNLTASAQSARFTSESFTLPAYLPSVIVD
ncbi:MAG: hypothetical protein Q8K68_12435 [Nitrospirota bacterium]|nr:hypothetical protein [Nitrospirota bacterium]